MGCRAFALRCCLWRRWCSGRRRARPLCVPVGGGPPASRPRCELRSARRLEARPGPAAAHRHRGRSLRRPPHRRRLVCWRVAQRVESMPGPAPPPRTGTAAMPHRRVRAPRPCPAVAHQHRGQAYRSLRRPPHRRCRACWRVAQRGDSMPGQASPRARTVVCPTAITQVSCPALVYPIAEPTLNSARNSLMASSNHEFISLELQRFQTLLNVYPIELRATFLGAWPHRPSNFACNSLGCVSWFEV